MGQQITTHNFSKHTRFLFNPSQMDLIVCSVYALLFKPKQTMSDNQISYERQGKAIYCYITIAGKKRKSIGIINEATRTFSKKISMTAHTFNKSNSIAIAYELLKLDFDFIIIECGYNIYKTTRKFFLEHSDFKQFSGYELQKFLSMQNFGMERAESWEREQKQKVIPVNAVSERYNRPAVFQMELF